MGGEPRIHAGRPGNEQAGGPARLPAGLTRHFVPGAHSGPEIHNYAKRSQFADAPKDGRGPKKPPEELPLGSVAPNKPNSRRGRVGRGHRRVGRGANVQNEPNLLSMGSEDHRQGRRP